VRIFKIPIQYNQLPIINTIWTVKETGFLISYINYLRDVVIAITSKYNESGRSSSEPYTIRVVNTGIFESKCISDGEQEKNDVNTPFSFTARATLDSCYLYEDLDNKLKHGSVVIA
jgi:hypothetical protein